MKDLWGKSLKLKESVTLVAVEASGALLDAENRCYYDLNYTAFFLLKLIEKGYHYESLQTELVSKFNIDEEIGRNDIDSFINGLIRLDIIQIVETASEYPVTSIIKKGNTLYETPTIEYKSELAVACAPTLF
jgi:hypothetical protein